MENLAEFARQHGLAYMTAKNHMKRGACKWPRKISDGKTKHPLYKTWESMRLRCNNPKATGYENYGGRGVTICVRWLFFKNFVADMGDRPEGYTLDRIDVNGHYEPGNCRWATARQQSYNKKGMKIGHVDAHGSKWRLVTFNKKYSRSFDTEVGAREYQKALTSLWKYFNP